MLKILVGLKIMLKYSIIIRLVTKYKRYLILSVINGAWPSGKAAAFGAAIRRFESCRPSQIERNNISSSFSSLFPLLSGAFLSVRLLISHLPLYFALMLHFERLLG